MNALYKLKESSIFNIMNQNKHEDKKIMQGNTGDIVSALIIEKTKDTAKLKIKDWDTIEAPSNSIKGEKGDEVFFKVLSNDENRVTLKQVFPEQDTSKKALIKNMKASDLQDLLAKSNFIELENGASQTNLDSEAHIKKLQALSRIKNKIAYIVNNAGSAAIGTLLASGISLDKISLDMLLEATKEIKGNPFIEKPCELNADEIEKLLSDAIKDYKVKLKDKPEENLYKQIVKPLSENDMPVNEKNINGIKSIIDKLDKVTGVSDNVIAYLLRNRGSFTVDNIYAALHKASNAELPVMPENTFNELMPDVEKQFSVEHIEKTEENYKIAKFLIENNLALIKENIDDTKFLREGIKNVDRDALINLSALNIKENSNASNIDLRKLDFTNKPETEKISLIKQYESLIRDMPKILNLDIEKITRRNIQLTLGTLQAEASNSNKANEYNNPANTHIADITANALKPANTHIAGVSAITTRRQLVEIALKLTYESAGGLIAKNISIDTMPLEQALQTLKNEENEIYARNLRIMGAPLTEQNVNTMSTLYSQIQSFPYSSTRVYSSIFAGKTPFSINSISSPANVNFQATKNYEEMMLPPNPKYGDSFKKAENQIAGVIATLGFDTTDQNIRAAKILSQNNMEITEQNLLKVKTADEKVSKIYKTLHPMIAAKMIKDGHNPLNMDVDDIIKYIDAFSDEYGENTNEKLARYIIEMDKGNIVSSQNREAIVAVYRMLNKIKKNGGVALGATLNADKKLTLGNLFDMAKVFAKTGGGKHNIINFNVGGNTGTVENTVPENNITAILQKAYDDALVGRFISSAEPKAFDKVINEKYSAHGNDFKEAPLERLINELDEIEKHVSDIYGKTEINKALQQVRNMHDSPLNAIRFMEKNNIALTVANIETIKNLMKNQYFGSKTLNELIDGSDEFRAAISELALDTDLTGLEEENYEITNKVAKALDDISQNTENLELIEKIEVVKRASYIRDTVLNTNSHLSIPVKLNGKLTEISMYVVNSDIQSKNEVNMFMSLDTGIGSIQVYIKSVAKNISVSFTAGNPSLNAMLSQNSSLLNEIMEQSGFLLTRVDFSEDIERNFFAEAIREGI